MGRKDGRATVEGTRSLLKLLVTTSYGESTIHGKINYPSCIHVSRRGQLPTTAKNRKYQKRNDVVTSARGCWMVRVGLN